MSSRRDPDAEPKTDSDDDKIVKEAKKRFQRCQTWEAIARKRWIEDEKFENGDSDNLYQWPDVTLTARGYGAAGTGDQRPCLTVNKTRQHVLQIINDARQNRTHIKFRPTGNGATYEAAQVMDGLVRHIEYISNAQQAYATATRHQVIGGIGYLRIVTDYAGPDTFEQEIYIRRVKNPLTVYLDPDIQEADGSDARFGFVFEDMPKDEFETRYPHLKDMATAALNNDEGWITDDHVRIAEYFRREEVKDQLVAFKDPQNPEADPIQIRRSEMNRSQWRALMADILKDPDTQTRDVIDHKIHWYKIAGQEIIEERPWLGSYVPIIRVPGEETVIDGELDRKGHVRALKDPQRMYNYNASAQVEFGALQNKIPYIAAAEAIEGYETYWQTANNSNYSVLPHNAYDDEGRKIEAPQRQAPPTASQAYELSMKNAANDMMLVSGQYQADFGAPSNERSGVAIQQRQRQGATATYHYIDHLAMAIRFAGKIILDLIPKVYDTKRVIKIMAEDGSDSDVVLDPKAAQAYLEQQQKNADEAKQVIFNPNVGRYDVISDVGPDFATRRQEAFNALSQIIGSNQELMMLIGDLMFKSADVEYADEIAQRLERLVPAAAKGDEGGPNPQVVALQQQLQTMSKMLETTSQKLQEKQLALADKSAKTAEGAEKTVIDAYRAETDRIVAFKDYLGADPEAAMALLRQVLDDAMNTHVTAGIAA
jgi:hypothetical protein